MNKHIRTHTANSEYKCNICRSIFVRNSYLVRHKIKKHKTSSDNQAACNSDTNTPESLEPPVCELRYGDDPVLLNSSGQGQSIIAAEIAKLITQGIIRSKTVETS